MPYSEGWVLLSEGRPWIKSSGGQTVKMLSPAEYCYRPHVDGPGCPLTACVVIQNFVEWHQGRSKKKVDERKTVFIGWLAGGRQERGVLLAHQQTNVCQICHINEICSFDKNIQKPTLYHSLISRRKDQTCQGYTVCRPGHLNNKISSFIDIFLPWKFFHG